MAQLNADEIVCALAHDGLLARMNAFVAEIVQDMGKSGAPYVSDLPAFKSKLSEFKKMRGMVDDKCMAQIRGSSFVKSQSDQANRVLQKIADILREPLRF